MNTFADYEKVKRRYLRQSRLDAARLRALQESEPSLPVLVTPKDNLGAWIAFFVGAVVILMVLVW